MGGNSGGGSGIRTHDTVACITVFKTAAIVHSAIPPSYKIRSNQLPLAKFAIPLPFSLRHSSPKRLTASSYTDGNTWEFKSAVIAMLLCPSLSETILR